MHDSKTIFSWKPAFLVNFYLRFDFNREREREKTEDRSGWNFSVNHRLKVSNGRAKERRKFVPFPSLEPSAGEQVDGGGVPWREGARLKPSSMSRDYTAGAPFHAVYRRSNCVPIHASWDSWRAPCAPAFIDVINMDPAQRSSPCVARYQEINFSQRWRAIWNWSTFDPSGFKKELRSKFRVGSMKFMLR